MTVFLILGVVGLALVIVSLVIGEVFEGLVGDLDTGGVLSTPVIGAFLAAFGFGAALIEYSTEATTGVSALGGLGAGVVIGGIALLITRNLMNMATDEPVRSIDLAGESATVITRIPADGIGEVSLVHRGNLMKLGARSAAPVAAGVAVKVTTVISPSMVVVTPLVESE